MEPKRRDGERSGATSLDVVREELRTRHYSRRTEEAYVSWIRRFVRHNRPRHPREIGEAEARAYLAYLAVERHVSASTQSQALAALQFLYRDVLRRPIGFAGGWLRHPDRTGADEARGRDGPGQCEPGPSDDRPRDPPLCYCPELPPRATRSSSS
jgi:hypothetical protein